MSCWNALKPDCLLIPSERNRASSSSSDPLWATRLISEQPVEGSWRKPGGFWWPFRQSPFGRGRVRDENSLSASNNTPAANTARFVMDHADLVKELAHIEKLTNQERLKLAHSRRRLQLKNYEKYEKFLSSGGKKPVGSKQQQQMQLKLYEQQQQQMDEVRRAKSKNKPRIRFRNSIMLLEAAGRNDIQEVRRLLENNVDPDVANEDGLTALHQCCIDDNEDMMKLLLDSGANVNSEDSEKWTPLHAAATCGHLHLVKHLIVKGANLLAVNAEGNMPYDICDEESTLDFIESEMAKRGVTQELIEEIRAMPETRMLEDVERIQADGGDLEYRDADGATYLHVAAANGYLRVVEFLLDNHVATDMQDKDCWQPIHAAACWGHVDVLELLVQNGADLNARTKNNETPYAICEDPEIKERIVQLRSEQETKLKEAAVKKIRRSVSSNSRTQSIRRTSQRDKGLTSKRDAAEEALTLMSMTANHNQENSPSPTAEIGLTNGVTPVHNHESSLTSEEDATEVLKSQPPYISMGRDSITQLSNTPHLRVSSPTSRTNSQLELNPADSPNNNINRNIKNTNELNNGRQTGNGTAGGKYHQKPVPVSVLNHSNGPDTNANLPKPDITSCVEIQPKLSNTKDFARTTTGNGVAVNGSNSSESMLGSGNSTIDIRVQVTINTNNNGSSSPTPTLLPPNNHGYNLNNTNNLVNPAFVTPGTLSDLKKQRSLQYISRNNTFPSNGSNELPPKYAPPPSPTMSLKKFAGDPGEIVGDYSDSGKKCCAIM